MPLAFLRQRICKSINHYSLRWLLIIPFSLQIVGIVGFVGYLSWKNEQEVLQDFIGQLLDRTDSQVNKHLENYLSVPVQLAQVNASAIQLGHLKKLDFPGIGRYFWKQMQLYDVSYISYALPNGEYAAAGRLAPTGAVTIDHQSRYTKPKGYTLKTDLDGKPTGVVATYTDYNPLSEDWYRDAVQAKKLTWTKPYNWDETPQHISISATNPVYDSNEGLICVIAVDILLSKMSNFLQELNVSPGGEVVIIDRQGLLIGSSTKDQPFELIEGKAQRVSAFKSKDELVSHSAKYWRQKLGSLSAITKAENTEFTIGDRRFFSRISPWRDRMGLDWLIMIVVPESDFTDKILASRRNTILLMAIALLIASLITNRLSRWLTQPILEFMQAAREIAAGNLDRTVQVERPREMTELAASFNHMARELAVTIATLERNNAELENRVAERTASLSAREAEQRAILEAMTELVLIMDEQGRSIKVLSGKHLTQMQSDLLLNQTLLNFLPSPQAEAFRFCIQKVLKDKLPKSIESNLFLNSQESWFSTNISYLAHNRVVAVARNITNRKAAAIALEEKNQQLTQAIEQLKTAQADLVQAEKMAILGQLIAGIAHEINTPLGAIKASIGNIDHALEEYLVALPQILGELDQESLADFLSLLNTACDRRQNLSSREERQLKRQIKQQLNQSQLQHRDILAEYLVRISSSDDFTPWYPLLQHPRCCDIFQTASYLGTIKTNSANIELAVTQATQIVLALKNYARSENSLDLANYSVIEGIETVLIIYHNKLKQGIQVVKNYSPVPDIPCYPEKLIQVWSNLIGNAIQAMNYRGKLEISVFIEPSERYLVVSITDDGSGISPEIQDKIFEPFFTTKPYGEGTGLGLDIVRKIVSQHQGEITVDSQPGCTTFTVSLPLLVKST